MSGNEMSGNEMSGNEMSGNEMSGNEMSGNEMSGNEITLSRSQTATTVRSLHCYENVSGPSYIPTATTVSLIGSM